MSKSMLQTVRLVIVSMVLGAAATAQAGSLLVAGSPAYDPATGTGLKDGKCLPYVGGSGVNNSGTAVGYSMKYVSGTSKGYRARALGRLGHGRHRTGRPGHRQQRLHVRLRLRRQRRRHGRGVLVEKYVGGSNKGHRAVRWDASGTAATELGNLGTDSSGYTTRLRLRTSTTPARPWGMSTKYVSGGNKGHRAVRWDASGTTGHRTGQPGHRQQRRIRTA